MKLLIITQKVDENDDVLGFFVEWIRRLAGKAEYISIVCLFKGEYRLPDNVRIFSLGKEESESKIKYLFNFYRYIWQLRNDYDSVFVHMNPRYVILGAPFWKIWRKKIILWYASGGVSGILRLADKFTDVVVASTQEGYRIPSKKLVTIGQGIDINKFVPDPNHKLQVTEYKIVSVGRITPSKDYGTLIRAVEILRKNNTNFKIEIVGQPATEKDVRYLKELRNMIKDKKVEDVFKFVGPIANKDLPPFLWSANLFVNMSHTGSLDKAVLEAMASGRPILTCNEAFKSILGDYDRQLMFPKRDHNSLAREIDFIMKLPSDRIETISSDMRKIVIENHSLNGFIDKLWKIL